MGPILGQNEELEFLLVEEFVDGPHLDHFLRGAYKQLQDRAPLQASLRQLANFLSQLHQRGQEGEVSQEYALSPLAKYIEHLKERELADAAMLERLREALKGWQGLACWRAAPAAWLHGDCTPINFIFVGEDDMVIIDLERCHRGDPMRDLGSLEAELRLASISMARDPRACQPEIQVLQEAYGLDAGQQERLQFWVGTYLVRISRNDWHQEGQRLQILEEALSCLSRKPCSLTSTTP